MATSSGDCCFAQSYQCTYALRKPGVMIRSEQAKLTCDCMQRVAVKFVSPSLESTSKGSFCTMCHNAQVEPLMPVTLLTLRSTIHTLNWSVTLVTATWTALQLLLGLLKTCTTFEPLGLTTQHRRPNCNAGTLFKIDRQQCTSPTYA